MSEQLPSDGTLVPPEPRIYKKRGRKPGGKNKTLRVKINGEIADIPNNILDGGVNVRLPKHTTGDTIEKGLQIKAIPPGPYKDKHDLWNALFVFQNVMQERKAVGLKPLPDHLILGRMKLSASDIHREIQKQDYKKFRVSMSATDVQQTIADIAPAIRISVVEFMNQLRGIKKCDVCGRAAPEDIKKMHDALQFIVYTMDKFGLPKIDTSFAENADEMDTKEAIEEAARIIEEVKSWPNFAIQRVVRVLVESDPRANRKDTKVDEDKGTPKDDGGVGPDEVVHPVPVSTTAVPQQEEILGDDIVKPVGEDSVAGGGLHALRTGETPIGEDSEERSTLDFRGEERQD